MTDKAIEVKGRGLVCDNPKCDYRNETIAIENYAAWIGALCPDCGEVLLTEDQYEMAQLVMGVVNTVNEMADEPVITKLLKDADLHGSKARMKVKVTKAGGLEVGEIKLETH